MLKLLTTYFAIFALLPGAFLLSACGSGSNSTVAMELAGTTEIDQLVRSAATNDDRLVLVTSASNGEQVTLRVFEPDDNGKLEELGALTAADDRYDEQAASPSGIAIEDDIAYVPLTGENRSGIWAVDISDPENPNESAFLETPGVAPVSIATSGDLAAVSTGLIGTGVTFVDTSSPEELERISAYEHAAVSTASVELSEDTAFFADSSGVTLIDVSDTAAPEEAGVYEDPDWSGPEAVPGAEGGSSSSIQDPGMVATPGMAVDGDYLYVANGTSGLDILDVSNPANVEAVGTVETEFAAISVSVSGDFAYVLSRGQLEIGMAIGEIPYLLQKVDITDPEAPEVTEEITDLSGGAPSPYQSVVTGDEHLYVINAGTVDAVIIAD